MTAVHRAKNTITAYRRVAGGAPSICGGYKSGRFQAAVTAEEEDEEGEGRGGGDGITSAPTLRFTRIYEFTEDFFFLPAIRMRGEQNATQEARTSTLGSCASVLELRLCSRTLG